jgi:hypothetical protein
MKKIKSVITTNFDLELLDLGDRYEIHYSSPGSKRLVKIKSIKDLSTALFFFEMKKDQLQGSIYDA